METHVAEISETLQKYGFCVLPGIGKLELIQLPAERLFQENRLNPPAFNLVLTSHDPNNELPIPSVADQIALSYSLTREEAETKWQNTLQNIKDKLSTGSSVVLHGLGWLNLGEENEILFVSSLPHSLLYTPVSLKPVHDQEPKPDQVPPSHIETTPVKPAEANIMEREPLDLRVQSRARWWIVGSIAVLIVIGWFTYEGTRIRERKKDSISGLINQHETKENAELMDTIDQAIDSAHKALELTDDSIHYLIVIATYDNKEKAEHQYNKMRAWGHPVELIHHDNNYELGWPFTSLPADTTVNMVKMMNLYGKNIRIEYVNP